MKNKNIVFDQYRFDVILNFLNLKIFKPTFTARFHFSERKNRDTLSSLTDGQEFGRLKNSRWRKIGKKQLKIIKYIPLRSKKAGRFDKLLCLLGVTPLWQVAQWVPRSPPHNALPAFPNLSGTNIISRVFEIFALYQFLVMNQIQIRLRQME